MKDRTKSGREVLQVKIRGFFRSRVELWYDPSAIPENGAMNVLLRLRQGFFPRVENNCEVFGEFFIGEREHEKLDLSNIYQRAFAGEIRVEKRIFRISDLKNAEDIEYVKNAQPIVFTGLCREGTDLMYNPSAHAFDSEIFENQRKALYGEISGVKLFAVRCMPVGLICCDFYNEITQQLSTFILNYNEGGKTVPNCATVRYGLEEYLIVYESCFGDNYVLQYADSEGKKMNKKTYISTGF